MSYQVKTCVDKKWGWFEDEKGVNPIKVDSPYNDDPIYMQIELAYLFAAAPDLLTALENLVAAARKSDDPQTHHGNAVIEAEMLVRRLQTGDPYDRQAITKKLTKEEEKGGGEMKRIKAFYYRAEDPSRNEIGPILVSKDGTIFEASTKGDALEIAKKYAVDNDYRLISTEDAPNCSHVNEHSFLGYVNKPEEIWCTRCGVIYHQKM